MISHMLHTSAIILSGAPNSYARYPKLSPSYETRIVFDFRTKQRNALLLYTDDNAKNSNFYAITICDGQIQFECRLGDDLIEVPQRRAIMTIRVENIDVSDNRWHSFNFSKTWDEIRVQVDEMVYEAKVNQRNFIFRDSDDCSDVYIGGIPKELYLLPTMSSPLRRYTKTFAGIVKNLIYRISPQGMTSPTLIKEVGLRQSDEDHCEPPKLSEREGSYCKNEGICYSTNEGPKCDCSFSEYDGRQCEQPKTTAEVSFFKDEFLGYDESDNFAATVQFRLENITFTFKTVHGNAIMFAAGHERNYLQILLENGHIIAISKFEGTEKRILQSYNDDFSKRYDDNAWHTVTLVRSLTVMVLTVDGKTDKVAQYAPGVYWITNSYAFVGGIPADKAKLLKLSKGNFRGCMKKIKYEADAFLINFIELAGYELGESVVKAYGNLAFSCRRPDAHPDVLSFNSGQHYLTLPKWITDASGSIGFELRTREKDGLILYHAVKDARNNTSDYVAFELVDGHLFLVINLGSGPVRIEATDSKITDGKVWHSVTLERMGRSGTVIVDTNRVDFSTPGVSANLNIDEEIFIGSAPWVQNDMEATDYRFPSTVWTINLRKGFVGCLRNVRVNGISSEIASVYEDKRETFGGGVTLGCSKSVSYDFCLSSPCKNLAQCENGYRSYSCDCSNTFLEGQNCDTEPNVVNFANSSVASYFVILPYILYSDAETIDCKFRTKRENTVLLDSKSDNVHHRIAVFLVSGKLVLLLKNDYNQHVFDWGNGLNDSRFHSFRIKRRGEKVLFFLDGKSVQSYILPSNNTVIEVKQLVAGRLYSSAHDIYQSYETEIFDEHFDGQMIKAFFNGNSKNSPVTFENNRAFAMFSQRYLGTKDELLRVSFRFRTLAPTCILFAALFNTSRQAVVLMLELVDGKVKMTVGNETHFDVVLTPSQKPALLFNDMKWHSVLVHQIKAKSDYYLTVDKTSVLLDSHNLNNIALKGDFFFGGLPSKMDLTSRLSSTIGFRGCMSSAHVGDNFLDIQSDADQVSNVTKGCFGPQIRCSKNPCQNGGRCVQQWNSVICDCSMSTHGGIHCDTPGTTYVFDSNSSMIYYEYPASRRPSRSSDRIALGFQTRQADAVLLSIQCSADGDYSVIYLHDGYLQVRYNLGDRDYLVQYLKTAVNDNQYHALNVLRNEANMTIKLDSAVQEYVPEDGAGLKTLNEQWRICVGASFIRDHRWYKARRKREQLFDPFHGSISGVNVNGIMLLDMYAKEASS